MKLLTGFTLSLVLGFLTISSFLKHSNIPSEGKVLAEKIEETSAPSSPTPTPSPSPSPTPSPTPMPSDTPTPTPIVKKATPSPTPTSSPSPVPTPEPNLGPTPDVWSPPEMDPIFARYAGEYGVDKNVLERIANCESHFNPNAVNGGYVGMFQFNSSSWKNNRQVMGLDPNPDLRKNVEESIRTAAYVVKQNGTYSWPSCLR